MIDAATLPAGYQVQLVPAEYAPDGVFGAADGLARPAHGPVRFLPAVRIGPRRGRRRTLAPELLRRWRAEAVEALSLSVLRGAIARATCSARSYVLERLPEIYTRFILAVDPPSVPGRRGKPALA